MVAGRGYLVSVEWSSASGVIVVSSWWLVVASLPGVLVVSWCHRGVLVSSVVSSWWLVVSSWCPGVLGGVLVVAGGGSLVLVVLLGGWWWIPGILARILQPGTQNRGST